MKRILEKSEEKEEEQNAARLVPFDPALSYWLVVHIYHDGVEKGYLLFNPKSVPNVVDLERIVRCLDSAGEEIGDDYKNPGEFLEELDASETPRTHSLRGAFCKMPAEGTAITITRVLTGMDVDY
jgi:hypothetical protein